MKMLLSTTALVLALGFPTLALSQAAAPAVDQATMQQSATNSGFLARRSQSDVFASELMGHDVYARRTSTDMNRSDGMAGENAYGTHGMAMMNRTDLDAMDNIGQINEIVLSKDGQVRALVIGAGGFLGMGEHDIAVTLDQVTFASDADDRSEMYIIANAGADELKGAPAYERTMTSDATSGNAGTRDERPGLTAPKITRDGYNRVEATEVSTEMLMGETVYDGSDNDVGSVTDMIVDDAGKITNVIIDFGGFLGIGNSQVSIGFDQLTIMSTEGHSEVRVYVDATKEQIQSLPKYQAKK